MHDQFKNMLDRYKTGTATEEDIAFLESWYAEYQPEGVEYSSIDHITDATGVWDELQSVQPEAKRIFVMAAYRCCGGGYCRIVAGCIFHAA